MMTIKAFAELCGCTAQTLRYYDRVGVLRPAKVDKWSGYRYYEARQAIDFIKIRNLQAADFTIGEVCALLNQPDEAVYEAFESKIAQQEQKLQQIRNIQQTYLREKNAMEKVLHGIIDYLLEGCGTPEVLTEFGYGTEDFDRVMEAAKTWLESALAAKTIAPQDVTLEINGERTQGLEAVTAKMDDLPQDYVGNQIYLNGGEQEEKTEDLERIWEKHGWEHPHEFLRDVPPLTGDREYHFSVRLKELPYERDLSYAMLLVGVMMLERGAFPCQGCDVEKSDDGVNHFILLRKKADE